MSDSDEGLFITQNTFKLSPSSESSLDDADNAANFLLELGDKTLDEYISNDISDNELLQTCEELELTYSKTIGVNRPPKDLDGEISASGESRYYLSHVSDVSDEEKDRRKEATDQNKACKQTGRFGTPVTDDEIRQKGRKR